MARFALKALINPVGPPQAFLKIIIGKKRNLLIKLSGIEPINMSEQTTPDCGLRPPCVGKLFG